MSERKVLILELIAVNRYASCSILLIVAIKCYHYYIPALYHKVFDYSMERASLVSCSFIESLELTGTHLSEIFGCLGYDISEQFHLNSPLTHSAF
jgi:hypothetical protein